LSPYERLDGLKIRRVGAWPAKRDYYFAPGIYRVVAGGRWDIVHVQSYHTLVAPLAMIAALRSNIPYILTFHGGGHSSRLRNSLRPMQQALLRPLLVRANRLVATARFEIPLYGERLRIPRERFVYIPNGSDIAEVVRPASRPADGALIASVGRLERYKGHQRIIAAMPYLLAQKPDARLWIAGEGSYEPALRRLSNKLGVADRVEIRAVPASDREAMALELSRVSLVTLLSEYETHPMAALEAIAQGCSLLVADTSGLSELAEQGYARAIPLRSSPEQVAEAVLDQLRDPLGPPRLDPPTWDACARDLFALYLKIGQEPRCIA
jgi:glycosyltransferase involved in cell wall biosynthesis